MFLNPERVSMPDVDSDFCYERRQEVIDYVVKKYGKDNVSQIITFGTMAAKMCIRDVGRAMDYSYAEVDKISKMIPTMLGITIDKALELNSMFKEPLGEREVIRDTKSAQKAYVDKKYKYTNTKLIEILDITLEEQMHLKTIISGKEKYRRCADEKKAKQKAKRRNENGLTKKQQELQDLKIKILALKEQNLSNRAIGRKLEISETKVRNILKK